MIMESRDPAIKLFGMKIPFPAVVEEEEVIEWSGGDEKSVEKVTPDLSDKNTNICTDKDETTSTDPLETNDSPDDQQTTPDGKPILKKPTKILPCPRCKSMDTKFCYYNNYNINQPRHFCKACQRYWTAGGTMRNVPVGAGRRKNKSSASQYRHITISEALEAARLDPGFQGNTRVLSFAHQQHHGRAQASFISGTVPQQHSVMKLQGDQKVSKESRNRFIGLSNQARVENKDDCSSGSSVTTSNNHMDVTRSQSCITEPQINKNNMNGYACFPWPYPTMPPQNFYHPMPFYPYWTIPMLPPQQSSSPMSQKGSTPNSPTLGKHSRDQESGCVIVPKTLRIDDPNEAAKSSIWKTLGIKNEGVSKGGMFKGFDQKTKDKDDNAQVLSANPAALSRSHNFHEQI